MISKIRRLKLFEIVPWLWLFAGFLYNVWYQIYPGKWILDADLASEMVLADMLNSGDGGHILSTNWYYSSELRVFQSQWFYRIGLLIFPDNWHCARIVASALMLGVFALVVLWFFHVIKMDKYGPWCAAILMWPFGKWYLVYGLYGTYYMVYMFFSLIALGIVIMLVRTKGLKSILLYFAGAFCAVASGMNGIKQTTVFYAPLALAVVVVLAMGLYEKKPKTVRQMLFDCNREIHMVFYVVTFVIWNLLGYFINVKILTKVYSFREFNELTWAWELPNRLYDVWLDFILLFGHQRMVKVVSFWGVVSILGIILGIWIVCSVVKCCVKYQELTLAQRITTALTATTLVVDATIFCLIGEYKQYYWLPLIPFAFTVLLINIEVAEYSLKHAKKILLVGIAVGITLCSVSTVKQEIKNPLFGQYGYNEVADFLVENGYTQGYALFWNSNVLREMSDGKIETWTIYSGEYDIIYEWLQEKDHVITKPEVPYFLFVNRLIGGGPEVYNMLKDGKGKLVFEKDPFYIYVFEE